MPCNLLKASLCAALLHLTIGSACAQFVWLDANGTRQYSDRPPPASVPKNRVMKDPGLELRSSNISATEPPVGANAAASAAAKAPQTTAEKNADFNKRKTDQAEQDRKMTDESKEAAAKAKNCERVQAYTRSLQSGERVATMDKNGEKSYLSDDKRAQETADAMRALNGCK